MAQTVALWSHTVNKAPQISSFLCSSLYSLFHQWYVFRLHSFLCCFFFLPSSVLPLIPPSRDKEMITSPQGALFVFKGTVSLSLTWRPSRLYNWNRLLLGHFHRDYQRRGKEITSRKQIGLLWFLNSSNVSNARKWKQGIHQQGDNRQLWLLVWMVNDE